MITSTACCFFNRFLQGFSMVYNIVVQSYEWITIKILYEENDAMSTPCNSPTRPPRIRSDRGTQCRAVKHTILICSILSLFFTVLNSSRQKREKGIILFSSFFFIFSRSEWAENVHKEQTRGMASQEMTLLIPRALSRLADRWDITWNEETISSCQAIRRTAYPIRRRVGAHGESVHESALVAHKEVHLTAFRHSRNHRLKRKEMILSCTTPRNYLFKYFLIAIGLCSCKFHYYFK